MHIRLHDNLTAILGGTLYLHQLRGMSILLDHLHRSVGRLHELAQLYILRTSRRMMAQRQLLILRGGQDLIGGNELRVAIVVGDDHLRRRRLNGLVMVLRMMNGIYIVYVWMDVLTK